MYTLQISIKKQSGFDRKLVTSFLILGNSSSDAAVKSGGGSMGEDAGQVVPVPWGGVPASPSMLLPTRVSWEKLAFSRNY